jgi:hypothetical protein
MAANFQIIVQFGKDYSEGFISEDELDKKLDKTAVKTTLGTSTTDVPAMSLLNSLITNWDQTAW